MPGPGVPEEIGTGDTFLFEDAESGEVAHFLAEAAAQAGPVLREEVCACFGQCRRLVVLPGTGKLPNVAGYALFPAHIRRALKRDEEGGLKVVAPELPKCDTNWFPRGLMPETTW